MSYTASTPAVVAHVLVAAADAIIDAASLDAAPFFNASLPSSLADAAVQSKTLLADSASTPASVGFCSLSTSGAYRLYLAARALGEAEAYSSVYAADFDMARICGQAAAFECQASAFTDQLQPQLRVNKGPALTIADAGVDVTSSGLTMSQVCRTAASQLRAPGLPLRRHFRVCIGVNTLLGHGVAVCPRVQGQPKLLAALVCSFYGVSLLRCVPMCQDCNPSGHLTERIPCLGCRACSPSIGGTAALNPSSM